MVTVLCLLEGPDAGGKSSLAEAVSSYANSHGIPSMVKHTGAPATPDTCPFTEYESQLDTSSEAYFARSRHHLLLFDRYHTGEAVYGPLYRGRSRLSQEGMYHVELSLDAMGAMKLLLLPQLATLEKRLQDRGGEAELQQLADIKDVRHWYGAYGAANGYQVFDGESAVNLEQLSASIAERYGVAGAVQKLSGGRYIGSMSPDIIFCGDIPGDGPAGRPDLIRPFTPYLSTGPGSYLLQALLQSGSLAQRCGIVNVNDPEVKIRGIWRVFSTAEERDAHPCQSGQARPVLVALGDNAAATLRRLELPHRQVPHPAYMARFRRQDLDWYAASLAGDAE